MNQSGKLHAKFNFTIENLTVYYDASSSWDPDNNIVNYSWDFGDGTNETGLITNHTYSNLDDYKVILKIIN